MSINIFRGDAPTARQIVRIGPPSLEQMSSEFIFSLNGKPLTADGWNAASIAAAWNALTLPEYREVAATTDDETLVLTGPADGTPFEVIVSSTALVTVTTVQEGAAPLNEKQTVTIPASTGGTFTLGFGAETTGAIAYNATAADVKSALEALTAIGTGEVAVTGNPGGPWTVEFKGSFAASEISGLSVDTSSLVINSSTAINVATIRQGQTAVSGVINLACYGFAEFGFEGGPDMSVNPDTNAASLKAFLDGLGTGQTWTVTGTTMENGLSATAGVPTTTLGAPYIASIATPPQENIGWVSGTAGQPAIDELQRVSLTGASGGTFTLSFSGDETTALDWDATTGDVEAALEALASLTAVTVTGVPGSTYDILFTNPGQQNIAALVADGSSLIVAGTVTETQGHTSGTQEVQDIEIPDAVTGGSFVAIFAGDRSTSIAYNASASTVETALETIEAIADFGGVSVVATGPTSWRITFAPTQALNPIVIDPSNLTVASVAASSVAQNPGGPTHWNDPLNWTQGRPPETGDDVWLDQPRLDLTHSLRQRTLVTLHSADTDTLRADGEMHFADGQKITLRTTGTLPGGLTAGDYYVVDPDRANRTFALSATRGGDVISLTSGTGTGTHTALVELNSLHVAGRFTGALGLPRRNRLGYYEYRQQYLAIGFDAAGDKLIKVGEGEGTGSGRVKIDHGADDVTIRIVQTGGSSESGVPACLIIGSSTTTDFVQLDGDSGASVFPDESCAFRDFDVRSGTFYGGEGLTILREVSARPGSVRGRYVDASGNSHRWE